MRGVQQPPTRFLTLVFIVLSITILVCAAATNAPWWSVQTSGLDTNLRAVSANGVILQSKDEGKTRKQLHMPGGARLDFRGIPAFDAQVAHVMSSGEGGKSRIYKTTDGGANWKLEFAGRRKEISWTRLACDGSSPECMALSDPVDVKFLIFNGRRRRALEGIAARRDACNAAQGGRFCGERNLLRVWQPDDYFCHRWTGGARIPFARSRQVADGY